MAKEKKIPVYLTWEEVQLMFENSGGFHYLFVLELMYFLGLRVSELCKLKKEDFNLKEKYVVIQAANAKRKKERHVPIPEAFLQKCKNMLACHKEGYYLADIGPKRVWQIVKSVAKKAGIKKNVSPHTFRHSYATEVYSKTGKIELVKELLGHSNLNTTMIYTKMNDALKAKGIEGVFG